MSNEDIKTQVEETLLDLYLGKNRVGFNGRKLNDKKQMENPALQEATTQILSLLTDEMAKYQKELRADYDEDIREARVEELEDLQNSAKDSLEGSEWKWSSGDYRKAIADRLADLKEDLSDREVKAPVQSRRPRHQTACLNGRQNQRDYRLPK